MPNPASALSDATAPSARVQAGAPEGADTTSDLQLRVLVVTDCAILFRGLDGLRATSGGCIELFGPTPPEEGAALAAEAQQADLVLLDADLPEGSTVRLVAPLVAGEGSPRVVVFTHSRDERQMFEALGMGGVGYLLKSSDEPELVRQLKRAAEGHMVIDPSLVSSLARAMARSHEADGWSDVHPRFSRREGEVARLLVKGLPNREIASQLFVSEETVKTHVHSIYRKLNVRRRAEAVGILIRDDRLTGTPGC